MGLVHIDFQMDASSIQYLGKDLEHTLVPEEEFFERQAQGFINPWLLPKPDELTHWNRGRFADEEILYFQTPTHLFIIADTDVHGYCFFRFLKMDNGGTTYKVAPLKGNRIIKIPIKGENVMNGNPSLTSLVHSGVANRVAAPMSMNAPSAPAPMSVPSAFAAEGVSTGVSLTAITATARQFGYVAGYVVPNAPRTAITPRKTKDGSYTLTPTETKPGKPKYVLMALPSQCVRKNHGMATISDIQSGQVDFNAYPQGELTKYAFPYYTAISYIDALGGRLPEYAPTTVPGQHKHWTPSEIVNGGSNVNFVYTKSSTSHKKGSIAATMNFHLKSTSARGSLYTPSNIFPLAVYDHVKVGCRNEKEAWNSNKHAFGYLRYNKGAKNKDISRLQELLTELPSMLWLRQYEVDGQKIDDGICSVFFLPPNVTKNDQDVNVKHLQPTYVPWHVNRRGADVTDAFQPLTSVVKRDVVVKPNSEGKDVSRAPVVRTSYEANPNHPGFRPYEDFRKLIVAEGFVSEEQLKSYCKRTSGTNAKAVGELTEAERAGMQDWMSTNKVYEEMERTATSITERYLTATNG